LLLEGKSITELLAQVRAEHGPDVTIVAADKIRTRGLGGFFARESYALTVEVDGPAPINGSFMHERSVDSTRTNRTPIDGSLMYERAAGVQAPGTLLDLAAAIDAAEATENSVILATRPMLSAAQQPTLSTASPEFASIMARLNALDAPPASVPQPMAAAATTLEADAYTRLREALAEIAPHIDFTTSVPLVLVIPPSTGAAPASTAAPVVATSEPSIPQQGRHRRAAAIKTD
jgi:hypothetical protein